MKNIAIGVFAALVALTLYVSGPAIASGHATGGAGHSFAAQGVQTNGPTGHATEHRPASPFSTGLSLLFLVMVGVVAYRMFFGRPKGPGDDARQGRPPVNLEEERRKRQSGPADGGSEASGQEELYRRARMTWEHLQGNEPSAPEGPRRDPSSEKGGSPRSAASTGAIPSDGDSSPAPGMDEVEFVEGAKLAYHRLTEAFDKSDPRLAEPFASEDILRAMRERKTPMDRTTEIVLVNAKLLDVKADGDTTEARVFYDVLLRRDPARSEPEQTRQVWRFVRVGQAGTWKLASMEEVND